MTQKSLFSATCFLHSLICNQTIKSELSEPSGIAGMEGLWGGKQHLPLVPLDVSSSVQPPPLPLPAPLDFCPFCRRVVGTDSHRLGFSPSTPDGKVSLGVFPWP